MKNHFNPVVISWFLIQVRGLEQRASGLVVMMPKSIYKSNDDISVILDDFFLPYLSNNNYIANCSKIIICG
jgi:hypothetical protein